MPSPNEEYNKLKTNIEKLIIDFVDDGKKLTDERLEDFSLTLQKFNEALKQPNIDQEECNKKIHLLDIPFARLKLHDKKFHNEKFAAIEAMFKEIKEWDKHKVALSPSLATKPKQKGGLPLHHDHPTPPLLPPHHTLPDKKTVIHLPTGDHEEQESSHDVNSDAIPLSLGETFAAAASSFQPGPTVRIETEDDDSKSDADGVGYYPYFKDKESQYKAGSKITIEIEIPNISPKDFAALKTALQETIDKNKSDSPAANATEASYHKVYAGASITPGSGNKFTFCINKKSAFDVNLEEVVGLSLTFANKSPDAQSIAAAGMISDTVGTYNKKSGVEVKRLIIQDYEDDLVAGLAIYCSLAGQDKPVCFGDKGGAFNATGKENNKRVFDLLQELYKTPEGRDQLLHLVDDGNKKLTDMIKYAKENPECTNAGGIRHVPASAATPSPKSTLPEEPGPLEVSMRSKPPIRPRN